MDHGLFEDLTESIKEAGKLKRSRKMKHEILGNNILVKQKEALRRTAGGIVVPDESQIKPLQGTVIKMGRGFAPWGTDPMKPHPQPLGKIPSVREGDEVLFDRFAGTRVELDGEEFLIMFEEDILILLKGVK